MTGAAISRPARVAGLVFAAVLGAILLVTLVMVVWVGVRGFLAYGHLRDAQAAAESARSQLTDPAAASGAIDAIAADTAAARSLTSDPLWRLAEGLPWAGPQLSAVSTIAASLDDVAGSALAPLVEVASSFSFDALRPQAGRIDLAGFVSLQDAATTGADGIAQAAASLDEIDHRPLVAPLRSAVDEVDGLLQQTRGATDALARATLLLPSMLGADGPRNYLVLFQNNAEWRSLGGIPGAMAVIHTDGGAMSLAAQGSSSDFTQYEASVLPLSDEILAIYGDRPGKWIQNVTQVPDFAVSAELAKEMWARENGGQQVDGVIALDPVVLSYMLAATGPVPLPTGDVLTTENAVPLLLNDVYQRYQRPADQDLFFAAAAAAVFSALSDGTANPTELVTALARAGDEHRLLMWSAHPEEQAIIAGTTLAGGLPVTDDATSTFGVYLNDGTGSKMDFYLTADSAAEWTQCTADAAGAAHGTAELTVTLTSNAPADAAALPDYITGGGVFDVPPGIARTVGYIYLPEGFELLDATLTGDPGFGGGVHDGRRVVSFTVDLAPGASATATIIARATVPTGPELRIESTPRIGGDTAFAALCSAP
ncbi:peptide synthetase [Microbacterium sp. Root61]|uniref:DUF4012 domain-containing protein n=1 Tax=Microbacterium sp. Root61 TaxID=1736570 RepID=UPI0006FA8D56|nr:DUF4012 domain-containing protein [Microbacterium sp. Root61]KRA25682.1 peptide synthetase [Microbacterium sp. Root61]